PRHLPGERFDEASARHLAGSGCDSGALPTRAGVGEGTGVGVVAGQGVVHVRTAAGRLAAVGGADVVAVAVGRRAAGAGAVGAGVVGRAGVTVVAGRAVRLRRVRADARARVAGPHVVALVGGRADHRVGASAHPALAGVGLRAGVAIVAHLAIALGRTRATSPPRIAAPAGVTLVGGGADDGVAARTYPALAGVGLRAGVAFVARRAVGLPRFRYAALFRSAGPHVVALVGGRADHRVGARAHPALAGVGLRAGVAIVA